jgi:hypothetical protein
LLLKRYARDLRIIRGVNDLDMVDAGQAVIKPDELSSTNESAPSIASKSFMSELNSSGFRAI